MKKRTVITTEKIEVWIVPQSSEVLPGVAQALKTGGWESESNNESLTASPEEHPEKTCDQPSSMDSRG